MKTYSCSFNESPSLCSLVLSFVHQFCLLFTSFIFRSLVLSFVHQFCLLFTNFVFCSLVLSFIHQFCLQFTSKFCLSFTSFVFCSLVCSLFSVLTCVFRYIVNIISEIKSPTLYTMECFNTASTCIQTMQKLAVKPYYRAC